MVRKGGAYMGVVKRLCRETIFTSSWMKLDRVCRICRYSGPGPNGRQIEARAILISTIVEIVERACEPSTVAARAASSPSESVPVSGFGMLSAHGTQLRTSSDDQSALAGFYQLALSITQQRLRRL